MSDFQSNYPREANVSPDPWSMELDGLNRTANIGRIVATIFGFVVGILIVGPILVGRWHIQSPLYITVESTFALSGLLLIATVYRWIVKAHGLIGRIRRVPPSYPSSFLGLICAFSFLSGFIFLIFTLRSFLKHSRPPGESNGWTPRMIQFALVAVIAFASSVFPLVMKMDSGASVNLGRISSFTLIYTVVMGTLVSFEVNRNLGAMIAERQSSQA